MYVPAFFEIFLGLLVVLLWTRWVTGRPTTPAFAAWIPWGTGGGVLIGQAVAGLGVLQASAGADAETIVRLGRWGSVAAVAAGLVLLAIATGASLLRKGETTL